MPAVPISMSKLRRPRVVADFVEHGDLLRLLEAGSHLPLTLVSAPGGYGKSSVVAHWLAGRAGLSAWLSLDRDDSDPFVFASYLVAAVRTVLPDDCAGTMRHLNGASPPSPATLASSLSNDFDVLSAPLVLILDDYHTIDSPVTHALLDSLLAYPSNELHLVLVARHDPPLSLGVLRVRELMSEIRLRDLRFPDSMVAALVERSTGQAVVGTDLAPVLQRWIEGWPAGARLAILALRQSTCQVTAEKRFGGGLPEVRQYFAEDVRTRQTTLPRERLMETAILDRFCASLCETVCGAALDSHAFMHGLSSGTLLCFPIDDHQEWFRYHPLFQAFLRAELQNDYPATEIAVLHQRAADWFEAHGLLEDAVPHALSGGGARAAGRLLIRHRNPLINREQRHRLGRCLGLLPPDTIESDAELLMMKAWLLYHQGRHIETPAVLDRIETLIARTRDNMEPSSLDALHGDLLALRGLQDYCDGRPDLALISAGKALSHLHADRTHASVTAHTVLAGARQMTGDLAGARQTLQQALAHASGPIDVCQAPLVATRCFIEWMAADLSALQWTAIQNYNLSGARYATEGNQALGRHFLALVQYQRNELSQAEATLLPALAPEHAPRLGYRTEISFVMAAVSQALGQEKRARQIVDAVCDRLRHNGDLPALFRAQACQADLALRQGRREEALEWARNFDPGPVRFVYRFFSAPHLTLARVWIAEGSSASREQAGRLLQLLEIELTGRHNLRFLIEVLALQALLNQTQGDEPGARERLLRAVTLAQPSGFIRLFVDLGHELVNPLKHLHPDHGQTRYIGQLLAAFDQDWLYRTASQPLEADITRRELKILKLLAEKLSNLEISDQLCISRATVKRHTQNIYAKLRASNRREAVARARALNILFDD
ncbi:MAG TPA: LuxR C-terminal-related transcriptional regulator [Accumulibacter sp.]|nr:LuxR C-terminal-related transcriptional regulator [Accumulibacter sp.]